MLSFLATSLAAAIAQAVAAGTPGVPAHELAAARKLPAGRLAGRAVIMRFAGAEVPAYVEAALRDGRAAGVILFRDNATSPLATRRITRALRKADPQALVAADQEGGSIRILGWAPPSAPQSSISSPREAKRAARFTARGLRRAGVNVNLAPVADRSGPGSLMDDRAFPGSTGQVARIVEASIKAYAGTGVAATAKHFPGLGAADGNTDEADVTINRSARAIRRSDLPPFQAAIDAGAPAVMVSHAVYPSLDPSAVASQSRAIVADLLKGRMGFTGVAMTDSLEAFAVSSHMSPGTAAVRSVRAGIDVVLTTGPGSHLDVVRALAREARGDPRFRLRLEDAAAHVMALRRRLASARR